MKVCPICLGRHDDSTACEVNVTSQSLESRENEPQVPGFRLDHLLTSAHQAETYRARNVASGRTCLIKVVAADDDTAKQAIREARIAANLFHPAVANFYDSGRLDDGRCFFVFEDVEGRTLRELIDNSGPPDLLDTVEIIREAAEALHALHRSGIIHGSVCPNRIIMSTTSGGQSIVRVTDPDFGRLEQRSIISNRFLIDNEIPSLRYFSPEQCSSDEATEQSDVYGLGVVYYEMLAGFPPFEASTAVGLIQQHMSQPPPDIRIANFNLRMLVTYALNEALQKQTRLRQPSINTLARQLRHIEQLATHSSTPPPAGTAITQTVVTPAMPAAPNIDSHPQTFEQPKILSEVEILEAELEAVTIVTTVAAPRRRVVSIEDALEESDSYITNLETHPPPRPSLLNAWKETLHSVTALFSIARSEAHESDAVEMDDVESMTTSPSRGPKKIEWDLPEDDIPSIDDVRGVLAMDYDMPLAISEDAPIAVSARDTEIEPAPRVAKKIEWAQPDDDIPSMDDVQEVLVLDHQMELSAESEPEVVQSWQPEPQVIHVEPLPQEVVVECRQPEPEVIQVESVTPEPEAIQAEASEPQEVVVEPSQPETIHAEASDPQEVIVETPQPETIHAEASEPQEVIVELIQPSAIHVQASEPQEVVVEPTQPKTIQVEASEPQEVVVEPTQPETIHVEASEPQEVVVEPTQPETIHVEASEPQEVVVEPTQPETIHAETSEPQEVVVEPSQPETIHPEASEPQEVVAEPTQPETIHAETSEPQEVVVEPTQPETIHAEASEPQEIIVEPEHVEPVAIEVEAPSCAPEIAPTSRAESFKLAPVARPSAIAAMRKRHKKVARRQPTELVGAGTAAEPEVVQVDNAQPELQEPVVEVPPQAINVQPATSEPQEIVAGSVRSESDIVIQVSAEPRAADIPVTPADSLKGVPALKKFAASAVQKRKKKLSPEEPVELVLELAPPKAVKTKTAASKRKKQAEPEVIHVEPANAQPQEIVVEPRSTDPEVVRAGAAEQEVITEAPSTVLQEIRVEPATSEPQEIAIEPEIVQVDSATLEIEVAADPEPEPIQPEPAPAESRILAFVPKRHKKSSRRQQLAASTPSGIDDEEITIVRPRQKRVRIHVTPQAPRKPKLTTSTSPVPAAEPEFFPTLLGGSLEPTAFTPEHSEGMFAAYSVEASRPVSRHRSHFIGGGIIALLALFLYGNDFLSGNFTSSSSADSMKAEVKRPEEPKPAIRPTFPQPIDPKPVSDKPVADKKERSGSKSKEPATTTPISHDSLTKVMILLPSKSAQVEAMSQSDTASPRRKASEIDTPSTDTVTRPRVVKDPSP